MTPAVEKERILVVDDAPDTLELIQRNLTANGYQVFTSSGVVEAIRLLNSTPVDLVITDLKMPKVSGLDLVRHIRAYGYVGRFYDRKITYYDDCGFDYWTMGAPLEETTIINRCEIENSYEYRLLNGTLPQSKSNAVV